MAAKKGPVDVVIVDSTYGVKGLRKSGKKTMLGDVQVLSNTAGPDRIPADLVVGAIHVDDSCLRGVLQQVWLDEMLEVLLP